MAKSEHLQKNVQGDVSKGQPIPTMQKIITEGQVIPKMTTVRQPPSTPPPNSGGKKQGK